MYFNVSKAKRQSTERLVVHFSLSLCERYLQLKQIWWEFESYVKSIFLPRAWLLVSTDQQILSADVKRMITMATPKYRWQVLVIRTRLIKLLKHKHRACPQEYAKKPALTHGSGFPSCLLPSRPAWTDRQTDRRMEGRTDGVPCGQEATSFIFIPIHPISHRQNCTASGGEREGGQGLDFSLIPVSFPGTLNHSGFLHGPTGARTLTAHPHKQQHKLIYG